MFICMIAFIYVYLLIREYFSYKSGLPLIRFFKEDLCLIPVPPLLRGLGGRTRASIKCLPLNICL